MNRRKLFFTLLLLFGFSQALADKGLWTPLANGALKPQADQSMERWYRADMLQLKQLLSRAGMEGRAHAAEQIELPLENGTTQRFTVVESPIMAPQLAARYPGIKTFKIQGIDDPLASGRLSLSGKGFHGMISHAGGVDYIDPQTTDTYRVSARKSKMPAEPFQCGVTGHDHASPLGHGAQRRAQRSPGNLQVYRLAVAATAEYVAAVSAPNSPNVNDAQAEVVVAINRVNEIYERDLGIRLELVANNDQLMFLDSATDGYSNNNGNAMLIQNQAIIDTVIGFSNYDVGHVFSTDGGGIAQVASVCDTSINSDGTGKASGVTGLSNPTGEQFYIDFVAHEIGHQFSAEHTFNGTTNSCFDGRVPTTAYEPGSGSTIMAYAGICGGENIASDSDAVFHAGSISQIDSYTSIAGGGNCGTLLNINNANEPAVDGGNATYSIPHQTPFALTASASNLDINETPSYSWDQLDAGSATSSSSLGFDLSNNALFRSYLPRAENYRHFPALGTTLQNRYDKSEAMACQTRDLNFRVTVRDGNSGMGFDDVVVSVDNSAGPFQVTAFNTSQSLSPGVQTLTWDVANTNLPPVSCSQVDISLLTFNASKTSYAETVLASNEANDGSASVTVPSQFSSRARFKVQCSDNIFYDISDADLTINGSGAFNTTGKTVFYNSNTFLLSDTPTEVCSSGGGTGSDESNDSFATAAVISLQTDYNYVIHDFFDFDYFRVSVPSSGTLSAFTSGTTDTNCRLFTANDLFNPLAENDDISFPSNLNCRLTQQVSAGTYYVVVDGFTNGPYTLATSFSSSSTTGGSGGGGGMMDPRWLVLVLALVGLRRQRATRQA